jgi:hypothetical protein
MDGTPAAENLCTIHNTGNPDELARLTTKFQTDQEIVTKSATGTALYIKSRLM